MSLSGTRVEGESDSIWLVETPDGEALTHTSSQLAADQEERDGWEVRVAWWKL